LIKPALLCYLIGNVGQSTRGPAEKILPVQRRMEKSILFAYISFDDTDKNLFGS
jgi:hypothetical protein